MKDFTIIANAILKNTDISDGAFRTYVVLKSFKYGDGRVFPSQIYLASIRGKSVKTIITHLKELKSLGLINYVKRGYSASNEYFFNIEENDTNVSVIFEKFFNLGEKKTSPQSLQKTQSNNTEIKHIETNKTDTTDLDRLNRYKGRMKKQYPNLWMNK